MKKITALLTVALLIVTVLLITVLLSQKAEAGKEHYLSCERVGDGMNEISRCVNSEVVCYTVMGSNNDKSISCIKK